MKIKLLLAGCGLICASAFAQKREHYHFSEVKTLASTAVKNQEKTRTCWAFSTASFLESEAKRLGKGDHDLSEMFVVKNIYRQKCENYVRRQGYSRLDQGGLAHDLLWAVKEFGIVPENEFPVKKAPGKPLSHTGLEKNLIALCNEYVQLGKEGKLPSGWLSRIDSLLDAELGKTPATFTYNGTQFTPTSFRDYLGINPDDYISVTSFSHHRFYEFFSLEIPDNWAGGTFYNLPLDQMMTLMNQALQNGYTLTLDVDVSNEGFSAEQGLAVVPEADWAKKDASAKAATFEYWEPEKQITQSERQKLFDAQETTDDHLMHVIGLLEESHSGEWYRVKNSWGSIGQFAGIVNCSEAYMRLNTISLTLHKKALPEDLQKKLGYITPKNEEVNRLGGGRKVNETTITPKRLRAPNALQEQPIAPKGKPGGSGN